MPVPFISVISEDRNTLENIQKGLQAVGYPARGYSTLKTALQSALSIPPSLIIIDLALNAVHFGKLLGFVRLQDKLRQIPLIHIAKNSRQFADGLPRDDHLAIVTKPITLGELVGHIRKLLLQATDGRSGNSSMAQRTARFGLPAGASTLEAALPQPTPDSTSTLADGEVPAERAADAPSGAQEKPHPSAPWKPEPLTAPFLPPRIHSVASVWLNDELEITVNGGHFLSSQEILEVLGIGRGGSTQLVVDGVAMPTLFFSSTQLKAHIPASQLTGRRQCTIQAVHPAPSSGSTPGVIIHLPPYPGAHASILAPATAAKSAPQPQIKSSGVLEESAPRIDRIEPLMLSEIAAGAVEAQEPLRIAIHGQAFPRDAAAYLDGTLLNTEYVSAVRLDALIPPRLAAQSRDFSVTVAYSRDRGLRLTNRCRLKIVPGSNLVPTKLQDVPWAEDHDPGKPEKITATPPSPDYS